MAGQSSSSSNQPAASSRNHFCDLCGLCLSSQSALRRHAVVHNKEAGFFCDLCGQDFVHARSLQRHSLIHEAERTGQKPFACNRCGDRFSDQSNCARHIALRHAGKLRGQPGYKAFTCYVCDRVYNNSAALRYHVQTHSGERPYVCDQCGRGFIDKKNFLRHCRITHTATTSKLHACERCGRPFRWLHSLKRHLKKLKDCRRKAARRVQKVSTVSSSAIVESAAVESAPAL